MPALAAKEAPKAPVWRVPFPELVFHNLPAFVLGASAGVAWRQQAVSRAIRFVKCYRFSRRRHYRAGYAGGHDLVLHRRGYAVGYSSQYKCPMWASAIICGDSVQPFANRTAAETFTVDADVAKDKQARSADFACSGYDRGHLIPRATASFDEASCEQTYLLTNVFPQDPDLNRGPWKAFEGEVRNWADRYGTLAIVVGTHFDGKKPTVMNNGVHVPDKVFAAVIALDAPKRPSFGILVPNVTPKYPDRKWTEQFKLISSNELETQLGRPIFRKLPFRKRPWFWNRRTVDLNFWL